MLTIVLRFNMLPVSVITWHSFAVWRSSFFAVNHRWGVCGGGPCSRQRSAGGDDEEEDSGCPGHGWCLHTDCIRSSPNCKLCLSTAGYYPQPILFLCCPCFVFFVTCAFFFFLLSTSFISLAKFLWTILSRGNDPRSIHLCRTHTVSSCVTPEQDLRLGIRTTKSFSPCPCQFFFSFLFVFVVTCTGAELLTWSSETLHRWFWCCLASFSCGCKLGRPAAVIKVFLCKRETHVVVLSIVFLS